MASRAIQSNAGNSKQEALSLEGARTIMILSVCTLKHCLWWVGTTSPKQHIAISVLNSHFSSNMVNIYEAVQQKKEKQQMYQLLSWKSYLTILRSLLLFILIRLCTTIQHALKSYLKQLTMGGKKLTISWKRWFISTC